VIFKIFFAESEKIALGKEILCREPASWLLVKKSLASVFSVPRAFCLALGKEVCLPSVFLCRQPNKKLSAKLSLLSAKKI
jgi:hypothetical protein